MHLVSEEDGDRAGLPIHSSHFMLRRPIVMKYLLLRLSLVYRQDDLMRLTARI
jgi:hypothetical protein